MTTPTLPEIRALAERLLEMEKMATPAPWIAQEREFMEDFSVYPPRVVGGARELEICMFSGSDMMMETTDDVRSASANRSVIATSRNAIRPLCSWLIAMIDALDSRAKLDARGEATINSVKLHAEFLVEKCAAELVREREGQ